MKIILDIKGPRSQVEVGLIYAPLLFDSSCYQICSLRQVTCMSSSLVVGAKSALSNNHSV